MHDRRLNRFIDLPQPFEDMNLDPKLLAGLPAQCLLQGLIPVDVPAEQVPDIRPRTYRRDRWTSNTLPFLITAPATQSTVESLGTMRTSTESRELLLSLNSSMQPCTQDGQHCGKEAATY